MRTLPGVSGLLTTVEEAWFSGCDCWTFVASLPYRLGVGADSTPADTPYLGADPARAAKWRERLARWGGKLKVGMFWAGRATHANDRRRSMALAQLAPLAAVPEVVFVSLQRDQRIEEALDPPAGMELIACGEELQSFADTPARCDARCGRCCRSARTGAGIWNGKTRRGTRACACSASRAAATGRA